MNTVMQSRSSVKYYLQDVSTYLFDILFGYITIITTLRELLRTCIESKNNDIYIQCGTTRKNPSN